MIGENVVKKIMAAAFALILFIGFVRGGSYAEIQKISEYLMQDDKKLDKDEALNMDILESDFSSNLWKQKELIEINGMIAKALNMQGFYGDIGVYVTDDKYTVSAQNYTTTDYEYDEIVSFKQFLDENGINLLYVNEPTKYIDDNIFREEFGIESYSNRNMDTFISRIREAGIAAIDLRDNIKSENLNVRDLFYRTDAHWKTPAGLWATQRITEAMNEHCGYHIDTSIYDISNYNVTEWYNCWLGEQGRKVSEAYVGLDDYTGIKPNFPTDYTFKSKEGDYDGTFDDFVNEEVYNLENDVYENITWHYSYTQINCINNDIDYGKVLILGDSFDQVTEPFISLGVHEVDSLVLRNYDDSFSLRDYIIENGYDTVLICYAQFMVGAHDDPSSANYRMFTFNN